MGGLRRYVRVEGEKGGGVVLRIFEINKLNIYLLFNLE